MIHRSYLPSCIPDSSLEKYPDPEPSQQSVDFIRHLLTLSVGGKVTINYAASTGGLSSIQVTVLDLPDWHGFITAGGGWSLIYYRDDAAPSYRVKVRKYRRRRITYLRLDDVHSVKFGW